MVRVIGSVYRCNGTAMCVDVRVGVHDDKALMSELGVVYVDRAVRRMGTP